MMEKWAFLNREEIRSFIQGTKSTLYLPYSYQRPFIYTLLKALVTISQSTTQDWKDFGEQNTVTAQPTKTPHPMNPAVNPDPEEGQETVDAEVLPIRLFLIYYPLTLDPKALHFYCPGEESAPKAPLWKDRVAVFNDSKLIYNLENDEEET